MKKYVEFVCRSCNKPFKRTKNRINSGIILPEKLIYCDNCFKSCIICGKRHGNGGKTCSSKECIKKLREETNLKKYGAKHNWGKNHPGRKTCEKTMLTKYGVKHNFQKGELRKKQDERIKEKYGVDNIFQHPKIKNKIKATLMIKYGVDNPKKHPEFVKKAVETFQKNFPSIREKMEKIGRWTPLHLLSEKEKYEKTVDMFTSRSIKKYHDILKLDEYEMGQGKGKYTIDHKFSKKAGFLNGVSPEIIGSIVNLEVMEHSQNSSKGANCSITLDQLLSEYKKLNERKENK